MKSVVNCFLAEGDRVHFSPSRKREPRLQKLGFHNHTPAMRFLPVVSHTTGEAIANVILSLMGHVSIIQNKLHSDGLLPLKLKLKRVKFRPVP